MSGYDNLPFSQLAEDMSEKNRKAQPVDENDYVGEDGLIYCHKCNTPRQKAVTMGEGKTRIVYVNCRCMTEASERREREYQEQKQKQKNEERRKTAFYSSKMRSWTFENDDRKNPEISEAVKKYADEFEMFSDWGAGLLLYGTVGTGKTYLAASAANAVIDKGYTAYMTNFSRILNELQNSNQKQECIDRLCSYALLVIDDLGVERNSPYALEQVYNIIDSRCSSGKPMIITTNLSLTEIVKCDNTDRRRIYDRVLEMCHPIRMNGESRRSISAKERHTKLKNIIGL